VTAPGLSLSVQGRRRRSSRRTTVEMLAVVEMKQEINERRMSMRICIYVLVLYKGSCLFFVDEF
jgi:hypothetical protein